MQVKATLEEIRSIPRQGKSDIHFGSFKVDEPKAYIDAMIFASELQHYQSIIGKEALVPLSVDVYNGRPSFTVSGRAVPFHPAVAKAS